jgi:hypothetical protein
MRNLSIRPEVEDGNLSPGKSLTSRSLPATRIRAVFIGIWFGLSSVVQDFEACVMTPTRKALMLVLAIIATATLIAQLKPDAFLGLLLVLLPHSGVPWRGSFATLAVSGRKCSSDALYRKINDNGRAACVIFPKSSGCVTQQ